MNGILTSKIIEFALGHLSPEESVKLLEEIEKSDEQSEKLELIVDIVNFFQS